MNKFDEDVLKKMTELAKLVEERSMFDLNEVELAEILNEEYPKTKASKIHQSQKRLAKEGYIAKIYNPKLLGKNHPTTYEILPLKEEDQPQKGKG